MFKLILNIFSLIIIITNSATLAILAMNAFPLDWDRWGELALVLISSVDAAMLLLYSRTDSIWIMWVFDREKFKIIFYFRYACYIGYRSLYQVMITIAQ